MRTVRWLLCAFAVLVGLMSSVGTAFADTTVSGCHASLTFPGGTPVLNCTPTTNCSSNQCAFVPLYYQGYQYTTCSCPDWLGGPFGSCNEGFRLDPATGRWVHTCVWPECWEGDTGDHCKETVTEPFECRCPFIH